VGGVTLQGGGLAKLPFKAVVPLSTFLESRLISRFCA